MLLGGAVAAQGGKDEPPLLLCGGKPIVTMALPVMFRGGGGRGGRSGVAHVSGLDNGPQPASVGEN